MTRIARASHVVDAAGFAVRGGGQFAGRESLVGRRTRLLAGGVGLAALVVSAACGANASGTATPVSAPTQTTPLQTAAAAQSNGSPVIVSCEPNQRTLVRPVVVNGATLSQIECITNTGVATIAQQSMTAPAYAAAPVYQPVRVAQPVAVDDYGDTRVIAPQRTTRVVRPVQTREVVYREPIRKQRSVKKSAVIIGSSAGVGAGVGAAVGGKKGALLGALIGGGGATVWDQITRRK